MLTPDELSARQAALGEGGSMTCNGVDFIWHMTLTCGSGGKWSDSGEAERTEHCECDNHNHWPALTGLSCSTANTGNL